MSHAIEALTDLALCNCGSFERGGVTYTIVEPPQLTPDGRGFAVKVEASAGNVGDGWFVFINPPLHVADEVDEDGKALTFKEDPDEALKQLIVEAVRAPKPLSLREPELPNPFSSWPIPPLDRRRS